MLIAGRVTELDLAEGAAAAKDDRLALHYLARVLATAPNSERGLALLAGIATRVDVLRLVPAKGFVGNTLLRAWALERAGAVEAIGLLARTATRVPHRNYDLVLASWLVARHAAGHSLPEPEKNLCYRLLAFALDSTIGLHRLWPGERALLSGVVDCAAALAAFPRDDIGVLLASAALRRAGRVAEAVALTAGGEGNVLVMRAHGLALRTAGRGAEAAEVFARVEAIEPDSAEIVEQARSWYVAGDSARALETLRRLPQPWDDEVEAIGRLCLGPPPTDPIAALDQLLRRMRGHGLMAPRNDATAQALRRALAEGAALGDVGALGWEAPSNTLALALASGKGGEVAAVEREGARGEPSFDPLAASEELVLWRAGRGSIEQAVPRPASEVREAVRRVAATEGDGLRLLEAAELEAHAFAADQAIAFARAMVHPLEGQAGSPDALYRLQCAAAAIIAHLPGPIDGPRGKTLRGLAHGQVDWTASAAIFALAHLARHDADAAHFAREALIDTVPRLLPHAGEPRAEQLGIALSTIPAVPRESITALEGWAKLVAGYKA